MGTTVAWGPLPKGVEAMYLPRFDKIILPDLDLAILTPSWMSAHESFHAEIQRKRRRGEISGALLISFHETETPNQLQLSISEELWTYPKTLLDLLGGPFCQKAGLVYLLSGWKLHLDRLKF